ncbi:RabGAP/TBC [Metschnikowia bicuspidata var. bicuspidata NRRL YB-4993]|uniref:RabGAP/TBC n=1 Tax=Metschnikowia bicuspidata var. bicuspidata NRRL YB-4993 TaxID=869754 RepID=A0A1A0HGQ9_9ASCO|nr:RabGAP/TBC [Metschnikowia bicuspidata var. bicuspidata NRRL YB-4993]OBA23175.1 RabGAP/TBC [Metschnikowia bicuspidata var. bicuspidata NRRL YB-4993]
MPKKKHEMSQVYGTNTNEFIFGEKGGRGKNLLSFLKNLSLTGPLRSKPEDDSPDRIRKFNSSIYGSMAYGYDSPDRGGSALTSISSDRLSTETPRAHRQAPRRTVSSGSAASMESSRPALRRPKYADLDDDWDAGFSDMSAADGRAGRAPRPRLGSAVGLVDLLHPDLMFLAPQPTGASPQRDSADSLAGAGSEPVASPVASPAASRVQARLAKFTRVLCEDPQAVNIQELRRLSWNGVPAPLRALTWQLLLGYLPTNKTRQLAILQRKRQEYVEGISKYRLQFDARTGLPQVPDSSNRDNSVNKEKQLFHQIDIDVKRTNQTLALYSHAATQTSLKRILFLWAIRHPASGYVQGINDICTPFYQIFLGNYLWQLQRKHAHEHAGADDQTPLFIPGLLDDTGSDVQEQELLSDPHLPLLTWVTFDPARLSARVSHIIEADSYWCISRLLDNITDNYIHEQPGIIKQVSDLQSLISKIDLPLVQHFDQEGVEFIQFSFRWMNCLLMRELSIDLVIRMWDTYLSEAPLGFSGFHIYVCAAFLIKFSSELKEKDFQDILLFLQNPPTSLWTEQDIELMLSEAFIWQSLYKSAGARLR